MLIKWIKGRSSVDHVDLVACVLCMDRVDRGRLVLAKISTRHLA